jgi:hypothetical protein
VLGLLSSNQTGTFRTRSLAVVGVDEPFSATEMRATLFAVGVWSLTFFLVTGPNWAAQANRITRADAERFESLRIKVATVVLDLEKSVSSAANEQTRNCLNTISYQGQLIARDAGHVSDLITLASLMRDSQDETAVLYKLYTFVHPFIEALRPGANS